MNLEGDCHWCGSDPLNDGRHHWCHVYVARKGACPCGVPLDRHPAQPRPQVRLFDAPLFRMGARALLVLTLLGAWWRQDYVSLSVMLVALFMLRSTRPSP